MTALAPAPTAAQTSSDAELTGVLVALPTPFTEDASEIDAQALSGLIEHLVQTGAHGLVPGGSTGEFAALSLAERKQLTELCVKAADGRVPVVAGTGATSTAEAVELAVHAAQVGAAAVMVVPPYYDTPTLDQFKVMLADIHQASGLPIMFYNLPSISGMKLTAEEIASLGEVPGVRWLKDTSGDAVALTELLVAHGEKITAFNGWDTLTFFGLAAGAKGSVWGATNIIPELSAQLWDAVAVRGDLQEGRELWSKIWPICQWLENYHYAAAIKTALAVVGRPVGPVRAPFALLDQDARAELVDLLAAAGVQTA